MSTTLAHLMAVTAEVDLSAWTVFCITRVTSRCPTGKQCIPNLYLNTKFSVECPKIWFWTQKFVNACCTTSRREEQFAFSTMYFFKGSETQVADLSPLDGVVFAFVVYFVLMWFVYIVHFKKCGNQITLDQGLVPSCEDQSFSFWQMQTEAQSWARWVVMFPSAIRSSDV